MTEERGERLPFIEGPLHSAFERWEIVVAPGSTRPFHAAEWQDGIVVVERGCVELECVGGTRRSFGRGAVVYLDRLPVRQLHNHGDEPAVLIAVSHRTRPSTWMVLGW
jgi:quercetin dioxygenase-like cupin family protein